MVIDGTELAYIAIACVVGILGYILKFAWGRIMGMGIMYATKEELKNVEVSLTDAVNGVREELKSWVEKTDKHHEENIKMQAQQHKDMLDLLKEAIRK